MKRQDAKIAKRFIVENKRFLSAFASLRFKPLVEVSLSERSAEGAGGADLVKLDGPGGLDRQREDTMALQVQGGYEGESPVLFSEVESVAHEELFTDVETDVTQGNVGQTEVRTIEQAANLN